MTLASDLSTAHRVGKRIFKLWLKSLVVMGVCGGAGFWYSEHIFLWLLAPADGQLSPFEDGRPVFIGPTQMFGTTLKLAFYCGLAGAVPFFMTGLYRIASPALSTAQRRYIKGFLFASVLLFASGAGFVYYVMLPVGLKFLLNFGSNIAIALISVTEYLQLLTQLMFWMGVLFQLPLAMYLSTKLGFISYRRFKWMRRVTPWAAIALGIILTPGMDPINAGMVAIPIVLLYEMGLFLAWAARPEEGNYLWLRSVRNAITWLLRKLRAFVLLPVTVPRWAYRKVRGD